MRALDRKLLRDLRRMRGQVITIALVLAAGIAASVALTGTYRALGAARDVYYARRGFPHAFVHLERAPDAVAARLAAIPGVAQVMPRVVEPLTVQIPGMARPAIGQAISIDGTTAAAARGLELRSGRLPDAAHDDEVLLLESFARAHRLAPGDAIDTILAGRRQRLRIAGVVLSPEFVFPVVGAVPNEKGFAVVWLPRAALAARTGKLGSFNDATFRLAPSASEPAVLAAIDRVLGPFGGTGAYGRSRQLSHLYVTQEMGGLEVMATRIPVIFLLVAAFLLNVVLARLVQLQREQIAVLRAVGYSRWAVARHILAFAGVIVAMGGVVGVLLGFWLGGAMTSLYVKFFHFPALAFHLEPDLVSVALAVCAGAVVIGATSAMRRVMRLAPAEAMRPPSPATYRRGWLSRIGLARLAGPMGRMIVREVERRPIATGLSVLGLAFSLAIIVIGRFSRDSIEALMDDAIGRAMREHVTVVLTKPVARREVRWFAHAPGVLAAEPLYVVPVRMEAGARHRETALTALAPVGIRRVLDDRGEVVVIPREGLLLSDVLARRLDVRPGDRVRLLRRDGDREQFELPIAGLVKDQMGLNAYLDLATLDRALGEEPRLNQVLLTIDSRRRLEVLDRISEVPQVAQVIEMASFRDAFEAQSGDSMMVFTLLVVGVGVVIAIGVVYNNARVALSERTRDLATLRVLGYTRSEVAIVLLGQLALQVVIATPIGLWLGRMLAAGLMATADPEQMRLALVISPATYGFATLVVGGAALVTALIVRRRLNAIDIVDALKARD